MKLQTVDNCTKPYDLHHWKPTLHWFYSVVKKGTYVCFELLAFVVYCKTVAMLRWLHALLTDLAIKR